MPPSKSASSIDRTHWESEEDDEDSSDRCCDGVGDDEAHLPSHR